MSIVTLTKQNFDEEVLKNRRCSAGGFLGNLVWSM